MSDFSLDSIDIAIKAIRDGKFIIVVDDEDRENEGDLIIAAEKITDAQMAMLVRHSSGIVCCPITQERADELQLPLMVVNNQDAYRTAYTVSIDFRHDTTTGISASDRVKTANALAEKGAKAHDFIRPGHVFPLIAKPAGVLQRAGHTEAAVDFCRLAGLEPVGVISELVNDDGTVKRMKDLIPFAKEHDIAIVSTADLIRYRRQNEKLVERVEEEIIDTRYGQFQAVRYRSLMDNTEHLALIAGKVSADKPTLVRVHDERSVDDLLGLEGSEVLDRALKAISEADNGVLVYLRQDNALELQPKPYDANPHDPEKQKEWREIGLGSQILVDLGVSELITLSNSQWSFTGLESFGLTLVATQEF
jgi:3,4-dihydroxy 2-butanone 4-phosphate synthase/GTP cyclohydrolase II